MSLSNRLKELLLDCLRRLLPHQWPGGDGFTQQEVLHEYPSLAARKLVPGEQTLHRLNPELATELAQFFAARTAQQCEKADDGVQAFVRPEQPKC